MEAERRVWEEERTVGGCEGVCDLHDLVLGGGGAGRALPAAQVAGQAVL